MVKSQHDYEALRGVLGYFHDHCMAVGREGRADAHPLAVLARMEAASPQKAEQGLVMAINDCLEMSARFPVEEVRAIDKGLADAGLPTLSALRLRYWKRIQAAEKRGLIRNEVEYYAIRGAAEAPMPPARLDQLRRMLEAFEERLPKPNPSAK